MFINDIFAAAVLAASAVTAAPYFLPKLTHQNSVKLCEHFNWSACGEVNYRPDVCVDQIGIFQDAVSSLDTRKKDCQFFVDNYCNSASGFFNWNGDIQNIRDHPDLGQYENAISSFRCKA
ncbi:hypothetical protein LZ554_006354 [Drepanopeziza brunnea f. sp. 'monogermtubi']|nr:hypothetical protein LZ554_006354 [Drepanopeziza brunnea f. sp. 'monogermtubi']